MTDHPLVQNQTPVSYFKELVEESLQRQRVSAGDETEFYLVNLLCQYVRVDRLPHQADEQQPLGVRFAKALDSGGFEQRVRLRSVGDFSLFMPAGFSSTTTSGSSNRILSGRASASGVAATGAGMSIAKCCPARTGVLGLRLWPGPVT